MKGHLEMAMLTRYQKSGGFLQLLQLIETCNKQKQDNFLSMILAEDPRWAQAIREKMITMEKIFSWDASSINEVAGRLQELTLATALHGLKPEEREKILSTYSHSQRRNIDDLFQSKQPLPAEVNAAYIKILQEVRSMITQGYLRVEKFAPELAIPEGIEEKIGKTVFSPTLDSSQENKEETKVTPIRATPHTSSGNANHAHDAEMQSLNMRLLALQNENTQLKNELKVYKEKIAQIKKIA